MQPELSGFERLIIYPFSVFKSVNVAVNIIVDQVEADQDGSEAEWGGSFQEIAACYETLPSSIYSRLKTRACTSVVNSCWELATLMFWLTGCRDGPFTSLKICSCLTVFMRDTGLLYIAAKLLLQSVLTAKFGIKISDFLL